MMVAMIARGALAPEIGLATELTDAASRGDAATVRRLLANGANVNEPDYFENTALDLAEEYDHPDVAKILKHAGGVLKRHSATEFSNPASNEASAEDPAAKSNEQRVEAEERYQRSPIVLGPTSVEEELVLVDGQGRLKIPRISRLLTMAGYTAKSPVRVFSAKLLLENQLGYPTLDSHYFIFTTKNPKPQIEKVLVILFNRGEDESQATNLLAYAPMLLFVKGQEVSIDAHGGGVGPKAFAHYIAKEFGTPEVKEQYLVYPQ